MHLNIVETESVFSGDLVALREVIDALKFVQTFIEITFAGASRPEDIPLMRVRIIEIVRLQNRADQLGVALEQFVEHFAVIDVIAPARA